MRPREFVLLLDQIKLDNVYSGIIGCSRSFKNKMNSIRFTFFNFKEQQIIMFIFLAFSSRILKGMFVYTPECHTSCVAKRTET